METAVMRPRQTVAVTRPLLTMRMSSGESVGKPTDTGEWAPAERRAS